MSAHEVLAIDAHGGHGGSVFAAGAQRFDARRHLQPRRAGPHARVRHHGRAQLRARRVLHGRRLRGLLPHDALRPRLLERHGGRRALRGRARRARGTPRLSSAAQRARTRADDRRHRPHAVSRSGRAGALGHRLSSHVAAVARRARMGRRDRAHPTSPDHRGRIRSRARAATVPASHRGRLDHPRRGAEPRRRRAHGHRSAQGGHGHLRALGRAGRRGRRALRAHQPDLSGDGSVSDPESLRDHHSRRHGQRARRRRRRSDHRARGKLQRLLRLARLPGPDCIRPARGDPVAAPARALFEEMRAS